MAGNEAGLAMARGAEALGRGDLERAATAFAAAVAADPALADGWFNLGWVQRALRRFDDALASYARALEAGIAGPEEVHVNRAAILSEHLHDGEAAADALRSALALAPGYPPALHGLAQLHEDAGRRDEAANCYRDALEAAPGDGRARARLALLEAAAGGDAAQAAAGVAAALARTAAPEDRAELLFAAAVLRDQAGEYPQAFAAAREANALAERLSPARYDPAAFEAFVDRTVATFPEPLPPPEARGGPVFLCGLFRSGSTLAEQILGRHPALTAVGELEAIPAMAQAVPAYPEGVARLADADRAALRDRYAEEVRRAAPAGARTIDKRCDNALHLGLIEAVLPDALVVRTRRHPLDTLLSTFFLRFGDGVPYGHRLDHAVHHAIHHERLMRHWDSVLPGRIVDLDYDRLVRDPRAALMPVLEHLGLDWDEALLDPRVGASVRTASNWQVRQPLHARSSGRWRHYAAELAEARRQFLAAGVALPD